MKMLMLECTTSVINKIVASRSCTIVLRRFVSSRVSPCQRACASADVVGRVDDREAPRSIALIIAVVGCCRFLRACLHDSSMSSDRFNMQNDDDDNEARGRESAF